MEVFHYKAEKEDANKRLDIFLAIKSGVTRSRITRAIKEGKVNINSIVLKGNYKIKPGDIICLEYNEPEEETLIPESIDIEVLYKDPHIMIVNKPPGMVMYPSAGHGRSTLMNAVAFLADTLPTIGAPLRPGVVHRIDKDTSGLVVIALTNDSYYGLVTQFSNRTIERRYIAIISGYPGSESGEISAPIGRSQSDRKKMSVKTKSGKPAHTKWKLIKRFEKASLIEAVLLTGRTHQIRVHFSSSGHPILGDIVYGKKNHVEIQGNRKIVIPRQMLHAKTLGFIHPYTKEQMKFETPLPEDMEIILAELTGV